MFKKWLYKHIEKAWEEENFIESFAKITSMELMR